MIWRAKWYFNLQIVYNARIKHSLHMVTSSPRSNSNLSCCPVMFVHHNNTVPLVIDLTVPVKPVTEQRHVLLYQMYCCCGYLVTVRRFGVDSVQTWQVWISHHYNNGQCHGVCRFVMVIVYCFKSFTVIFFQKCSNFSEYPLYTEFPRRKGPNFGRVILRSNYTDITQNTDIQSSMFTEILAREKCVCLLSAYCTLSVTSY